MSGDLRWAAAAKCGLEFWMADGEPVKPYTVFFPDPPDEPPDEPTIVEDRP